MFKRPAAWRSEQWLVFAHRSYLLYWASRFFGVLATQIIITAVGWQIYALTGNPLDLAIIGLVQFLPALLLVLVTGSVSDRFPRRIIMGLGLMIEAACCFGIIVLTLRGLTSPMPVFALLAGFGIARAFVNPAAASLVANVVPAKHLANAIAWNSSAWQVGNIAGPVAGGLLYGLGAGIAYSVAFTLLVLASILILLVPKPPQKAETGAHRWSTVLAGFDYIWRQKTIFGAISLDLFAVLLGGATALLPIFASDILELGPLGLGLLRAAPGIGAVTIAVVLATRPIRDNAGLVMFGFVAGFGACIVVFGLSTVAWLSILALAMAGACDMVSVYIRETLIQVWTPDALRGRVNAVNMVFVGASNELGEVRAGLMAFWIGAAGAVVVGGAGTIIVAGLWARLFPELRRTRKLDGTG